MSSYAGDGTAAIGQLCAFPVAGRSSRETNTTSPFIAGRATTSYAGFDHCIVVESVVQRGNVAATRDHHAGAATGCTGR
jgi:hypothetical protein